MCFNPKDKKKKMQKKKTLIFGPVKSRRLGRSLGIELVPKKICSMDCIYCEIGKTFSRTIKRNKYYSWDLIEASIYQAKEMEDIFDVVTFTGSGEPTLNIYFEQAIELTKKIIKKPIAVLTNSSLLFVPSVNSSLKIVDILLPSLDAARLETFKKINQPHPKIKLEQIIQNLKNLRIEMRGEMWLEILFVKGVNDSKEDLEALKTAIEYINPHKIQLNTVVRPPAYEGVEPVPFEELEGIAKFLGKNAEVILTKQKFKKSLKGLEIMDKEALEEKFLNYLQRRPTTLKELSLVFEIDETLTQSILDKLVSQNLIKKEKYQKEIFYLAK